ncbi:MAG: EVE domain-containing protein [Thaumarchaeota archaeon]|nr:EVE domain-containing protein [Nitrososphaerota archaeon]
MGDHKKRLLWATKYKPLTLRAKSGDTIIYYVKGTGLIRGAFRISDNWFQAKEAIWADEDKGKIKYPYQTHIESIKIGDAVFNEIAPKLSFVSIKTEPQIYLRAHGQSGVANLGQHVPEADLRIIIDSMTKLEEKEEPEAPEHDEIVAKLVRIGQSMGFEASTDREDTYIAKGAIVDAVWTAKVANLGKIKYVFEVQKGGSIDSLLLNLLKAKNDPAVRRLVAVSEKKQIESIIRESSELPEDFRKLFVTIDFNEIEHISQLFDNLNQFNQKMGFLG